MTGGRLPRRRQLVVLAGMTLANAMILVDQTAVPLAIPDIMRDLETVPTSAQWVLTANVLALASFLVLGGRLGDIVGRRRIFTIGAVVFVTGSAIAGASPELYPLIAARAVQGFGGALMMPATIAIISETFPKAQRGRALGVMGGIAAIFAALGPAIGGALTSLDWRLVFYVNVPIAALTLATVLAVPRLAPDAERPPIDWIGTGLLAAGLASLILGLTQLGPWGWSAGTIALLVLAATALAAFVVAERHVPAPLIEFGHFRHRNYLGASISQVIAGYAELGFGVIFPLVLILNLEMDPWLAGLALIPATLPMIVVAPLGGRWYDRAGGRAPLTVGFLVLAASGVALAVGVGRESYLALLAGLVLQGVGLSLVLTVNDPTGIDSIPAQDQGQASGVLDTAEQIGGALGISTLYALFHASYVRALDDDLARHGLSFTEDQFTRWRLAIAQAESSGLDPSSFPAQFRPLLIAARDASVLGYRVTFAFAALTAVVGALAAWWLVRRPGAEAVPPPDARPGHRSHGSRWSRFTVVGAMARAARLRTGRDDVGAATPGDQLDRAASRGSPGERIR